MLRLLEESVNTEFRASFAKDLRSIKNIEMFNRIRRVVQQVEHAAGPNELTNLKKLSVRNNYFRILIREYRIRLVIEGATAVFVRCLNRKRNVQALLLKGRQDFRDPPVQRKSNARLPASQASAYFRLCVNSEVSGSPFSSIRSSSLAV